MENRLEILRRKVDGLISQLPPDKQKHFYVHLYGVSHFAAILAVRRGLDPEIASVCGMLHDIYVLLTDNFVDHAAYGSDKAKEILKSIGSFTDSEIELITTAILRHSDKDKYHLPYDEVLKDADVLHHCFYNPSYPVQNHELVRYNNLLIELGLTNK